MSKMRHRCSTYAPLSWVVRFWRLQKSVANHYKCCADRPGLLYVATAAEYVRTGMLNEQISVLSNNCPYA